jgi:hypothetical protein
LTNECVAATTARLASTSTTGSKLTHVGIPVSWNALSVAIRSPGNGAARCHFFESLSSRLVSVAA